ncbi:TolC family protein [Sphingomonas sp. CL5.1]|uniref:TolC family protein n=1 Tax=Sphingomonas sp. CL5.1 TaxID=2653203 RepID=UPI0015814A1E|nr:TolC family protein [Sphingomonas sp. CL5.1]QKS00541.1 TolC family protein [Sphingomonas sp. CL5.1]
MLCASALLGLSGCENMSGGGRPITLAQLGLPDLYSGDAAAQQPLRAEDLTRWWRRFDDPLLDALVERGSEPGPVASGKAGYQQAMKRIATEAAIARSYVALCARQAKIGNIRAHLTIRREDQEIARFREEAKLVTPLDALQAVAESDRVAAAIPALEAGIAADIAHIAVLTGQAPAALREQLAPPAPIPVGPAEIVAGAPSDLLTHRPDARLAALRLGQARTWGGGTKGTLAAYREAVLRMLEEAENARTAFASAKAREAALDKAVADAGQLAAMARKQYREGTSDQVALQNAERALLAVRNERVDAAADRATALIDLFTALGGSWEPEADGRRP